MDIRPLTAAELLDRTFFFYRKHFTLFVGIAVIPALAQLLISLTRIVVAPSPSDSIRVQLEHLARPEMILLNFAVALVVLLAQGATIAAVSDVYLGRPSSIGKSFARLRKNLFCLVCAAVLMYIVVCFGLILLIIPGIFLLTALALTIPTIVIENQTTPFAAMKKSWRLTEGGRLRILLVVVLAYIVQAIVTVFFAIPAGIVVAVERLGDPSYTSALPQVLEQIGIFFASCLTVPLIAIATSLLYYDQRVRKEGFDIQFMISSLKSKTDETPGHKIF